MPILPDSDVRVSVLEQLLARTAVGIARLISDRSPERLRELLGRFRGSTRPATYAEAKRARDVVLTVSTRCCGRRACLVRSLATVIFCWMRGSWATWCAGVLAAPPFTAHAWVEADGEMVDEALDGTLHTTLCSV